MEVSCVSLPNRSQASDETAFLTSTAWSSPVPSRITMNATLPDDRTCVAQRATDGVFHREEGEIALRGRHSGIAILELYRRDRSRKVIVDDRAHRLASLQQLVLRNETEIAACKNARGDDVVFSGRGSSDLRRVVGHVGPAHDDGWVERQVLLVRQLLPKGVQDSRCFVDRAVAGAGRENPGRMCLLPAHDKLPAAHAPPCDGPLPRVLLECESNVTAFRGIDQRLPRNEVQRPGIFLVSRQRDDDSRSIELADTLNGLERIQYHEIAALHVGAPRTRCKGVEPHEPFAIALEYGIECL